MDTRIPTSLSCVPSIILQHTVSGKYVDMEEFLPFEFFQPRDNSITLKHNAVTDTVTLYRSLPAKAIETLTDWLKAWSAYEHVLVNSNRTLYNSLVAYRDVILRCSQKFQWKAVYLYDRHFRARLGAALSFDYGHIDHDLYVSIFDPNAVRRDVPRCHRCKSLDHKVALCPFPRQLMVYFKRI